MSNLPSPFISPTAVGPLSFAEIPEPETVLKSFKTLVVPFVKLIPYTLDPKTNSLPALEVIMSTIITSIGVPVEPDV